MVNVTKVAAWKVGNTFIEDAKEAEKEVRRLVVMELIGEQPGDYSTVDLIADWVVDNFDKIETRVKAAMAGA